MIFAAMLKSISSTDGSFKRMRFPWEWVVDGFLILLIMCSSLLYLNYIFEGNQVWCVPAFGPLESLETFEMLFVASCCKLHLKIAWLIYFPYFSAASVLLLMMSHFFWKEIPWIQSKINLFGTLCVEVMSLDQVFYDSGDVNRGMLRNFSFSPEQSNLVKHIQIKMFHLLLEKSSLSNYYICKTSFTSLFCVMFLVAIAVILHVLTFLQSSFYCKIEKKYFNKFNNQFSCDVSSALPTYAIMLFHGVIFLVILVITLKALVGHFFNPYPLKTVNYNELVAEFKSYPGFNDIMFMFALIQSNVYDGGLLLSNFTKVMLLKDNNYMEKFGSAVNTYSPYTPPSTYRINESTDSEEVTSVSAEELSGIDMDSDEDETHKFVSAADLQNFYLELLSDYSFEAMHQPAALADEHSPKPIKSWGLIESLMMLFHKIEPMFVIDDCSELVSLIQNEIINKKEYFLLYANCVRITKYNKEPFSNQQWFKIIASIDQLVQCCYFVVVSAFCNIYETAVTVITLNECERNAVEIFHPYSNKYNPTNSIGGCRGFNSSTSHSFYIAKAKHFYFGLRRTTKINGVGTIFDKIYVHYTEEEKRTLKHLLYRFKKRLKNITSSYNIAERVTIRKRPTKNNSVFVTFDWNPRDFTDL